jgi:hypothetical protein
VFGGATLGSTFCEVVVGQPYLSLLSSVETAGWGLFSSLLWVMLIFSLGLIN